MKRCPPTARFSANALWPPNRQITSLSVEISMSNTVNAIMSGIAVLCLLVVAWMMAGPILLIITVVYLDLAF